MKKTVKLILIASTIFATKVIAQDNNGQSPAMQLANHVNPFTGDFNYSIPLVGISGPNGESFPLNLNYAGGIKVDQQASWVGLGWDLNIGEINRQVNGVPDDFHNVTNHKNVYNHFSNGNVSHKFDTSYVFGPLYFDKIIANNSDTMMDLYGTNHALGENYFVFPDYDSYHVSGPGIGGEMRPFLFDFAEFAPYKEARFNSRQPRTFTKKPMFRFVDESMASISNSENFRYFINKPSPVSYYVEPLANNNKGKNWKNRAGDVNVFDAGNYIEYFTNEQIHKHYTGSNSDKIVGFLDCNEVIDRSINSDVIGAIRITTPNGMVYHYSLPVFTFNDEVKAFETNNFTYTYSSINKLTKYLNNAKHIYTWKLTAITDVTYKDINENSKVDDGDTGYWVSLAYSKWASGFNWRFPFYNFYPDETSFKIPYWFAGELVYSPSGTVTEGYSEIYYPEYVKTATQTAYFIKGIRADDHSIPNENNRYTPKLYLKNIVLLDNDDVIEHNIFGTKQAMPPSISPKFILPSSNVLNSLDYSYYQTAIETYALKVIDFDYDYHLSKKLANNINNDFIKTNYSITHDLGTEVVFKDGNFNSTTDLGQSGKLTLNKVTTFNLNHQQKHPPYLFEYNTENPDFKQEQQDIFGYYKGIFNPLIRDQYIIRDNDQVDAWSLSKIITPFGAEINVEYESDTYNGVMYDSENIIPQSPTRIIINSESADYAFCDLRSNSKSSFEIDARPCTEFIMKEVFGGGARVKTISLTDPHSSKLYQLSYSYSDGIATMEPDRYQRSANYTLIKSKSSGDRHAGGPAVGYSNVKITIGTETNNIGSIAYNYKNYTQPYNMSAVVEDSEGNGHQGHGWNYYYSVTGAYMIMSMKYKLGLITAQSNITNFGKLNSSSIYDANGVVVSKTIYEYSGINEVYLGDDIGRVQEVFYDYGDYQSNEAERTIFKTTFIKTTPVTHLKKETTIKDGLTTVINYTERDNFTGLPTKVVTTASGYAENISKKTFAYEVGVNSNMGPKTSNPNNLNILTPVLEEIESRGTGSRYEWSDNHLIREWDVSSQKYKFTSQTTFWSPTEVSTFNGLDAGLAQWKKLGTSTLYGGRNNKERVERKDVKDGYSAIKFGYDDRFKIAEVSNCNYASFTFSSFESLKEVVTGVYHFDGEVIKGSSSRVGITGSIVPHTGDYMVEVPSGQFGASYKAMAQNETIGGEEFERGIQVGRTYVASVWVHKNSPKEAKLVFSLDGSDGLGNDVSEYKSIRKDDADAVQIGDWIQLNLTFTIPANYISAGGPLGLNDMRVYMWNTGSSSAYYDDLVIHPADAQFTGYVYDERLGLVKAVISNDNFYTRFEHDNSGEVISTFKETQNGDKIVKSTNYNFKRN
ncbi:MAG: hypothetical protein AB7O47_12070 [Flavobacteriales bacterium]